MPASPRPARALHEDCFYLVLFDSTGTRVLAGTDGTPAGVWWIPTTISRGQERQWPQIESKLRGLGLTATPVHEAFFSTGVREDETAVWHHYVALHVQERPLRVPSYAWHDVDDLCTRRRPLNARQIVALRQCLGRVRHPDAPFDAPEQLRAVHDWVRARLQAIGVEITGPPAPQRMGRSDTIRTFPTTRGTMSFRGGGGRTDRDARLVEHIRALGPDHFPELLAADRDRRWWLTTSAAGSALSVDAGNYEPLFRAVTLLAETQRAVLRSEALQHVQTKPFDAEALRGTIDRLRVLLVQGPFQAQWGPSRVAATLEFLHKATHRCMSHSLPWTLDRVIARVQDLLSGGPFLARWPEPLLAPLVAVLRGAVYRLMAHDLPWTWTPAACRPRDLCFHDAHVRFREAEDSYFAPPTLALACFLDDLRSRARLSEPSLTRLKERYIEVWAGVLEPALLRRAIADTHMPGLLFAFWTHLEHLFRCDRVSPSEDPADAAAHPQLVEHANLLAMRVPSRLPPAPPLTVVPGELPGWRQPEWGRRNSS